jgi:hypothetical protein
MEMHFMETAEAASVATEQDNHLYTNIGKTEKDIGAMSIKHLNRIFKLKGLSKKGIREIKLRRRQLKNK